MGAFLLFIIRSLTRRFKDILAHNRPCLAGSFLFAADVTFFEQANGESGEQEGIEYGREDELGQFQHEIRVIGAHPEAQQGVGEIKAPALAGKE